MASKTHPSVASGNKLFQITSNNLFFSEEGNPKNQHTYHRLKTASNEPTRILQIKFGQIDSNRLKNKGIPHISNLETMKTFFSPSLLPPLQNTKHLFRTSPQVPSLSARFRLLHRCQGFWTRIVHVGLLFGAVPATSRTWVPFGEASV